MDKEARNTVILGLFVVLGILLLITAVYFIGSKKNMFTPTLTVLASFNDVNGLQAGEEVRFRGIPVGSVKKIEVLNDSILEVSLSIQKKMQPFIKKNAIASIKTDGLMGNKMVSLRNEIAPSASISENDRLKTLAAIDLEDVTKKLRSTNDKIEEVVSNLSEITDKINKGEGFFGTLLMDSVFSKNLKRGVRNLEAGAANVNKETEALKHTFLFRGYFKKQERKEKRERRKKEREEKRAKEKEEKEKEKKEKEEKKKGS